MVSLINKQLLLTAYAYLFIMEQMKAQQGSEAIQLGMYPVQQKEDAELVEEVKQEEPSGKKALQWAFDNFPYNVRELYIADWWQNAGGIPAQDWEERIIRKMFGKIGIIEPRKDGGCSELEDPGKMIALKAELEAKSQEKRELLKLRDEYWHLKGEFYMAPRDQSQASEISHLKNEIAQGSQTIAQPVGQTTNNQTINPAAQLGWKEELDKIKASFASDEEKAFCAYVDHMPGDAVVKAWGNVDLLQAWQKKRGGTAKNDFLKQSFELLSLEHRKEVLKNLGHETQTLDKRTCSQVKPANNDITHDVHEEQKHVAGATATAEASWRKVLDGIADLMNEKREEQVVLSPPTLLLLESFGSLRVNDEQELERARDLREHLRVQEDKDVISFTGAGLWGNVKSGLSDRVKKYFNDDKMVNVGGETAQDWAKAMTKECWDGLTLGGGPMGAALVYFKGTWATPFDAVGPSPWNSTSHEVRYMQNTWTCPGRQGSVGKSRGDYLECEQYSGLKIFSAPFGKEGKFRMLFFLPLSDNSGETIASAAVEWLKVNHNKWDLSADATNYEKLTVKIPTFKTTYENSDLTRFGGDWVIQDIFDVQLQNPTLTEARTTIAWDEKGAKAEAQVRKAIAQGAPRVEQATPALSKTFIANRPFVYALQGRKEKTAVTQIVGVVRKPDA